MILNFFAARPSQNGHTEGHNVSYCLLTKGDKGVNDHFSKVENIRELRIEEQYNAAKVVGVNRYQLSWTMKMVI